MKSSLLVRNIGRLLTPIGKEARSGAAMSELVDIGDAVVAIEDGIIGYVGDKSGFESSPFAQKPAPVLDAQGMLCAPGFVDSHTHFIFDGSREDEFFWRSGGLSYMDIHARGGGILKTVSATRQASLDTLIRKGRERLEAMLSMGVTTVEGKSGYGLDLDTELRQLEAMRILGSSGPLRVIPTYMGPHAVPDEFAGDPRGYIEYTVDTVLPAIRDRGLARFADIFCEEGIFSAELSEKYLRAARRLGFGLKLHADELGHSGGARLAALLRAASADHLLHADAEDFPLLREAHVVATCLPLTAFTLREPYADARAMIDSGLAVALATDFNPGSSYSTSIPLLFATASIYMGMTAGESLTALTLNGAAALGVADKIGSLEVGKSADFVLLSAPNLGHLAYNVGTNFVRHVVLEGSLLF